VWKPKVGGSWTPFQLGRWRWYDTLGYTWVSDESWGWLPYHYGRWMNRAGEGWVWVPASRPVFKPGDVYWLYGRQIAGWGPLAPARTGRRSSATAVFEREYDVGGIRARCARGRSGGFHRAPRGSGGAASLAVLALPSPVFVAARLEARRPMLRVGATRAIAPVVPGTAFDADAMALPSA